MNPQYVQSLNPSSTPKLITSFCNYMKLGTVDADLVRLFGFADFCARCGVVQQEVIGITLLQELLPKVAADPVRRSPVPVCASDNTGCHFGVRTHFHPG
jgi:hypothetical protein